MVVIVFSKVLGMLRDVVLANYFGTSNISDAYLIASSVPTLLFYFIGHALSTAFLPMYNKVKLDRGEKAADNYVHNLLCTSLIISTVIVIVLLVFPEAVVKIFAAGFNQETVKIAVDFIRVSSFSLYLMTVISVWSGYLQAKSNFIIPAMVSVPRNIAIMVSVVLAAVVHISFLGIGLLIAYICELLLLLPFVFKSGYRPKVVVNLRSPDLHETLYIVLPIMLGVGVSQINKIIDKSIASTVVEGGISALTYASVINNAVQEVLVTGIITVLFARCAAWASEGKHELVKQKTSETIQTMMSLLLPVSCGVVFLSREIVVCLLARGNFDENSTTMTVGALCCYTVGLVFLATRDTLVKVFYAYKMTRSATVISILSIVMSVLLKLILSGPYGTNGLAISTSISAIFQCIVLYIILYRRIGDFYIKSQLIVVLQSIIASSAMVAVLFAVERAVAGFNDFSRLVVITICGATVYFVVGLLIRLPIACAILNKLTRIFVRNKEN